MFAKLKELIFPCDKVINQLMAEHSLSVDNNIAAHEKFMKACGDGICIRIELSNQNNIENLKR